ncbi:alpha-tocopherol transfer protein-like [Lineus longissimus]|uniref:alpha-tocopherol transfer protein-like n=1 Tax=Lineus longissimus TaxID=88925 RepID=UPI002B4E241F
MSGENCYVFPFDEKTLKKAKKELNENPADRAEKIDCLRQWVKSHPYLTARTDDAFLLRFLRVAKFSLLVAQQRIENFCVVRSSEIDGEIPWFNPCRVDDEMIKEFRQGFMALLPGADDEGRLVMLTKFGNVDGANIDIDRMSRCMFLVLDSCMMDERGQINGVVFIEDVEGVTLKLINHFTPDMMQRGIRCWQDTYPWRLKEFHYMNMGNVFNTFLEMFKMMLKEKYRKRVKIHWNKSSFAKYVPKRMLPSDYGGDAPSYQQIVENNLQNLLANQAEIESLEVCRVDDAKRPRETPKGDSWGMVAGSDQQVAGSYRKINTD